jgi:phage gp36-like protein
MSYCALADIEKKRIPTDLLIQLTDDTNTGAINEDTVNGCIQDAQVMVEAYLRGRYPLPLDPVPDLAVSITADLAAYNCFALKPECDIPAAVQARRDTAIKMLVLIQTSQMKLYEDSPAPPAKGGPEVSYSAQERQFTRNRMRDY